MNDHHDDKMQDFDSLWDYDHPDKTEQEFRALLDKPYTKEDTVYHVELLTQIARASGLQQHFDQAHDLLNQAEKLLTHDLIRPRIRYLLERGRVFNSSGFPDKARPFFIEAWEKANGAQEDSYAVDAAHMVAIVEKDEAALEWNLKAMQLASRSSDERARKWLASLCNNIGWTYHDMGDYEKAMEFFQDGLHYREIEGRTNPIRIAKWCIARTLRSMGRVEDSLKMQYALLEEAESSDEKPGYTYEEIAECLLLLDRGDDAKLYFSLAYEVLSQDQWLSRNEPARLERLKALSL